MPKQKISIAQPHAAATPAAPGTHKPKLRVEQAESVVTANPDHRILAAKIRS
jgi:hypothetical protein